MAKTFRNVQDHRDSEVSELLPFDLRKQIVCVSTVWAILVEHLRKRANTNVN